MEIETLPEFQIEQEGSSFYFNFENSLWIRGYFHEQGLGISDMYYEDESEQGKGFGTLALKALKAKYHFLSVHQITNNALPFWTKMLEKGIVDSLDSYWDDEEDDDDY